MGFDSGERAQALTYWLGRNEPAETLAGSNQTFVADHFECPTHGDTRGSELGGHFCLGRKHRARRCVLRSLPEFVGDLLIADSPHGFASINSMRFPNGSSM